MSTDIVEVDPEFAFLTEYLEEDNSLDNLQQYRRPPILKVIQGLTSDDLKLGRPNGTVIKLPGAETICKFGDSFKVVPVFSFTEYQLRRDRNDKSGGRVIERSFDPGSGLAMMCKGLKTKKEGEYEHAFKEVLCFAILIYAETEKTEELEPALVTFMGGDFTTGTNWAGMISSRRIGGKPAPLWSQVWEASVHKQPGKKGDWMQLGFSNPESGPYITQEEAPLFRELHLRLAEEFKEKRIIVSGDNDSEGDSGEDNGKYSGNN